MKKHFFSASVYFLLLLASCLQEEDIERKYPRVKTHPVMDITPIGAQFSATFDYPDLDRISAHGFLWGEDSQLSTGVHMLVVDSLTGKTVYKDLRSGLVDKKQYFVRAFARVPEKTVYGDIVSFRSLGSEGPKIISLNPEIAAYGDTVTVVGKNFASTQILLQYGELDITPHIIEVKENKLTFKLPLGIPIDPTEDFVSISIEGNVSTSPKPLKLDLDRILPKIISISPLTLKACDTVTVVGKNFKYATNEILLWDNEKQLTILETSNTHVKAVLKSIPAGELFFTLSNGQFFHTSEQIDITESRPEVISLSSSFYVPKDILIITGKNFPYCDNSVVAHIDGAFENLQILTKSRDEIKVQLPMRCLGVLSINLIIAGEGQAQIIETISLTPAPPEIYSITPSHASLNDEVVIKGKNLYNASVHFLRDTTSTNTQISGKLMETYAPGGVIDVNLSACGGNVVITNGFTYDPVEITDFNPKTITSSTQLITITGKNFSSGFLSNNVMIHSAVYNNIVADNNTVITVPASAFIPDGATALNQSVPIAVQNATGMTGTSTSMLAINHEVSWLRLKDFSTMPAYGVSFAIGSKGYSGIGNFNSYSTGRFWEYDPASDSWAEKASYPGQTDTYSSFKVGVSANGKGYVGIDQTYYQEWWEYNPSLNTWTKKANYPGSIGPIGHLAFELNGEIYIGGGGDNANEFWEYDPVGNSWIRKADLPIYGGRANASFAFKGKGYIYGKSQSGYDLECAYDQVSNSWTMRQLTSSTQGGNMSMVFNDFVIIAGEVETNNTQRNAFFKIIPGSGDIASVDFAGTPRRGQFGFAIGSYGYFGLGMEGHVYYYSPEVWRYDPVKF